uniref:Uncharacterized protein n=2 Tax=Vibrio TaxID=662 RepID=A0A0H3ZS04_9VIBR|nr:hypothetical protein [Vibrio tasmaniensis]AKN37151.1 hypothetical protein [Vibrio genomosp. F6]
MNINWKIFTSASSPAKADKILNNVVAKLEVDCKERSVAPYHKGGYVCSFSIEANSEPWLDTAYSTIQLGQVVGRSWILTGSIEEEVDLWSSESCVSGVDNIHIYVGINA